MNSFNRWLRSTAGIATIAGVVVVALVVAVLGQQLGWWGAGPGTAGLPEATFPDPIGGYTCLPTCVENDAKFINTVAYDQYSFGGAKIVVWIGVPGNKADFQWGLFDGDAGEDGSNGNWDYRPVPTTYTLYADKLRDGSGQTVVDSKTSGEMANNAWSDFTVAVGDAAKAPSGHYFYRLEATYDGSLYGSNRFKLRSTAYLGSGDSNSPAETSLPLVGALGTNNDGGIVWPQWNSFSDPGPSTYTGEWQFYFMVPTYSKAVEIWDGDFDRGTSAQVDFDTDDPNTVGKPAWAGAAAVEERAGGKGIPNDNSSNTLAIRLPAVQYTLIDPAGDPVYQNAEPSGTEEWELFSMHTAEYDATITDPAQKADLVVDEIKAGLYTLHIKGLDLYNIVWLTTPYCISDSEDGCGPPVWPEGSCPRTIGYWKNNVAKVLIDNKTRGVQESRETLEWALDNVALKSKIYQTGIDVSAPTELFNHTRLTDAEADMILQRDKKNYPGDEQSMLARALQQNLATWLNLGSGKIGEHTYITLNLPSGPFTGTVMEALREAEDIILNGGDLERAKDIGDHINNGLLGEDAEVSTCDDYVEIIPPDKQPPERDKMPKGKKPEMPNDVPPNDEPVCSAANTYNVENPTNSPFYGIKFEFASGAEVKNGNSDIFKVTLPADVVQAMTSVQMEAKAAGDVAISQMVLQGCDFTSPLPCGEPIKEGEFSFAFNGAVDNGDGTYTLRFEVYVYGEHGLSHVTIGLPDGVVPSGP
ncbi:hypothetical protein ACFLZW_07645, partial [Chloroflexota bacterium]